MLNRLLDYFDKIGVDVNYSTNEESILISFDIDFDSFSTLVELHLDTIFNKLSLLIEVEDVVFINNAIFEAINYLNCESYYLKSYYDNKNDSVVIGANIKYYDDNIIDILTDILDSLVNRDKLLIENVYNSIKAGDDDLPDFLNIDKYIY